jgi:hypothetical protein
MADFWGPFLFGMGWLAMAMALVVLLRRSATHAISLRSGIARVLAWVLIALLLATFLAGLPFSLGLCRGGFDDPLRCSVVPAEMVEPLAPLTLLLSLATIVAAPLLAAVALTFEALHRRRAAIA